LTRTKLWRLSLAAILGFGWLFLTPASYSDDPLGTAAQQIDQLEADVQKLNDKVSTQAKIDIANSKYDAAVAAKSDMDNKLSIKTIKQAEYDTAVATLSTALSEKNTAQTAVDSQTAIVSTANTNKQNKQDALDVANINLSTAAAGNSPPTYSLNAYLYDCYTWYNEYNSAPDFECPDGRGGGIPAAMGPWSGINFNFGSGGPAGLNDDYQIKWIGYIKTTQHWTPQFRVCSDDGMILKISGLTVVNNWYDRGGQCGASNGYYMASNGWEPIEVWWYENGGGANGSLQWNIGNGWVPVPSSVFSTTIPEVSQQYLDALAAQQTAQSEYDAALATYNTENNKLTQYNQTLSDKTIAYNTAVTDKNTAQTSLNTATTNYNNSVTAYNTAISELNTAIIDAQNEYNSQWNLEEQQRIQAAIAQAMANQPQPTPEPTIEPTPEPSPEQTTPVDPTPTPDSETTDEPKPDVTPDPEPTVEPSPEPSPQPSDIDPEPTPEPEPTPDKPSPKPSDNSITEETANLIADLTSKDTLTKLSPEQKAAVAEGLGIKTEELAKVAALAASDKNLATALEQFGDRIKENKNAPMPYTLADATTEVATEAFLADPIGALTSINLDELLNPSEWGKDMTDDQREKAQEVVIPVIIASNIVAAAMTRRV
jgi:hypothetical protein